MIEMDAKSVESNLYIIPQELKTCVRHKTDESYAYYRCYYNRYC